VTYRILKTDLRNLAKFSKVTVGLIDNVDSQTAEIWLLSAYAEINIISDIKGIFNLLNPNLHS